MFYRALLLAVAAAAIAVASRAQPLDERDRTLLNAPVGTAPAEGRAGTHNSISETRQGSELSSIVLMGVIRRGTRDRALMSIDHKAAREYQVGETVVGAKIVAIRDDHVIVEDSGTRRTIWMNDDASHAATVSTRQAGHTEEPLIVPGTAPPQAPGGPPMADLLQQAAQRKAWREKNAD